ncbi:MAG: energy transducer TonB [Pseudomonadota bacterium]
MTAAVLGPGVTNTGMLRVAEPGLAPYRAYRPIVLAAIVGLHVGILIYATLLKPATIKPPEIVPVAMMQLLAAPSMMASVQASMPVPEVRPAPQPRVEPSPPKPKAVKTPPKPVPKPIVKTTAEPRPVSIPTPAESVSTPKPVEQSESAPSGQSGSSSSSETQSASAPPTAQTAKPAEAASAPSFSAAYLNNPPPVYPPMARRMGEEGKVMLRVYVTPQGTAGEVKVHTSSGSTMFDDAAQAAVKAWRFVPARQGENPIAAWVQVPIVFKLS